MYSDDNMSLIYSVAEIVYSMVELIVKLDRFSTLDNVDDMSDVNLLKRSLVLNTLRIPLRFYSPM